MLQWVFHTLIIFGSYIGNDNNNQKRMRAITTECWACLALIYRPGQVQKATNNSRTIIGKAWFDHGWDNVAVIVHTTENISALAPNKRAARLTLWPGYFMWILSREQQLRWSEWGPDLKTPVVRIIHFPFEPTGNCFGLAIPIRWCHCIFWHARPFCSQVPWRTYYILQSNEGAPFSVINHLIRS